MNEGNLSETPDMSELDDGRGYGTVWYSNAFEDYGKLKGTIEIGTIGAHNYQAVKVHRENSNAIVWLDDVERIDYHNRGDEP